MSRAVTEADIRLPEFRYAELKDLEVRDDGKIVRKDRWEVGICRIAGAVGLNVRSFEVDVVVSTARRLVYAMDGVYEAAADEIWKELKNGRR